MKKNILICLLISFGIASLLTAVGHRSFYQLLELRLYDIRMNLRTPPKTDDRIVFLEMDDEAIENLGRWPWPRDIFANVIDTLDSLGARQIIFDVTFSEPGQVIINRDAVDHVFKGKEQISEYIANETGNMKAQASPPQTDVLWALEQIRSGFDQYTAAAQEKLQNAIVDNDLVLKSALKENNVFIGYSFEVITEPDEVRNYERSLLIKDNILSWVREKPNGTFEELPTAATSLGPDKKQLRGVFLRTKILSLLEKNIEASLDDISKSLSSIPEEIRPDFNLVKEELIKERLLSFLLEKPDATFTDAIYKYQIFDTGTLEHFKNIWPAAKKELAGRTKFGMHPVPSQTFFQAIKMESPYYEFTEAVKGGGFLNGIPNDDGTMRFVPVFIQYKDKIFPHIAITSILDLLKPERIYFIPNEFLVLHKASINNEIKDVFIPIDRNGTMLINWAGRWKDTFRHVSLADVYRLYYLKNTPAADPAQLAAKEEQLKKAIKDSICIVGLTAAGTHDFNPIPYEAAYPMVGTHGNVYNSILTEQFITKIPDKHNMVILFFLAMLISLCLSRLSSLNGLVFTCVVLAGSFAAALYLFNRGLWLDLASPMILALFSYLGITSYKFSTEEKEKRQIKKAFSKYVSPDVIEEIIDDPSKLQLGGTRKELTVLFSDIRSFTTFSEKRKPEEVVSILNEYLDAMTKVVFENKGTLDKYVGDEIMAIFGAPKWEPPEESSKRAVITAWKMLERLNELQEKWRSQGLEPLDIGIGINTGDMVVGNMGSELRMDYTVIGDAVNLGARIEALTRQFNARLIISEATYNYVKNIIEVRPLEAIKVKGKEIPVMVYEVLGLKTGPAQYGQK